MDISNVKKVFEILKTNQLISIETEKQELIGRLYHVDKNLNFIILEVVKDLRAKVEYTSRQIIPAEMIKFLKPLEELDDFDSSSTDENSSNLTENTKPESLTEPTYNNEPLQVTATLSPYEIKFIQEILNNPIIIDKTGNKYDDALKDIKSQQVIALFAEPTRHGRNFNTSIITVATIKAVYVFDIISLGRIFMDFKRILEAEKPLKAIHDNRFVADHFKYRHDVHLNKVFDTFVAYCVVTKRTIKISFENIVENYFKISKEYFSADDPYYPHNTFQRPLSPKIIRECVKRAYFILKLQEGLQTHMLSKFYTQCDEFSRTIMDDDDNVSATETMQIKPSAGFQKIVGLDLRDQTLYK